MGDEQKVQDDFGNQQQGGLAVQRVRVFIVCGRTGIQEQVSGQMGDQKAAQQAGP